MTDIYARKNRIKEALELRNMKQIDLVEKAGVTKSALCSWIHQRWQPKQTALFNMAKVLGVSEMWLAGYDVPINKYKNLPPEVFKEVCEELDLDDQEIADSELLDDIDYRISDLIIESKPNLSPEQMEKRVNIFAKLLLINDNQLNSLNSILDQFINLKDEV